MFMAIQYIPFIYVLNFMLLYLKRILLSLDDIKSQNASGNFVEKNWCHYGFVRCMMVKIYHPDSGPHDL